MIGEHTSPNSDSPCCSHFAICALRFTIHSHAKQKILDRTGWQVSEIGYGMWGMGGWSGSTIRSRLSLCRQQSIMAVTFSILRTPTARATAKNLLGQIVRANQDKRLYTATKIPPKNKQWPAQAESTSRIVTRRIMSKSMCIEVWNMRASKVSISCSFTPGMMTGLRDDRWFYKLDDLRSQGLIKAIGISLNRWEPWNGVRAVRTGAD